MMDVIFRIVVKVIVRFGVKKVLKFYLKLIKMLFKIIVDKSLSINDRVQLSCQLIFTGWLPFAILHIGLEWYFC